MPSRNEYNRFNKQREVGWLCEMIKWGPDGGDAKLNFLKRVPILNSTIYLHQKLPTLIEMSKLESLFKFAKLPLIVVTEQASQFPCKIPVIYFNDENFLKYSAPF